MRTRRTAPQASRLSLESLEDRCLPSLAGIGPDWRHPPAPHFDAAPADLRYEAPSSFLQPGQQHDTYFGHEREAPRGEPALFIATPIIVVTAHDAPANGVPQAPVANQTALAPPTSPASQAAPLQLETVIEISVRAVPVAAGTFTPTSGVVVEVTNREPTAADPVRRTETGRLPVDVRAAAAAELVQQVVGAPTAPADHGQPPARAVDAYLVTVVSPRQLAPGTAVDGTQAGARGSDQRLPGDSLLPPLRTPTARGEGAVVLPRGPILEEKVPAPTPAT